ncbi:Gfo/Idh/MocA family protein [Friedmanniella luteola]|uniref:Gfo/Idh/MocA family protein n=1 Tax=Friedmanniella luteola TaxID=546871 RepID=UPI0018D2BD7E|nr:Gfo/Idh/MocA family oxidoreductase [Friedmanniella luteola]
MTEPDAPTTGWGILSTGHIASVLAKDLALLPDEATLVAVGSRSADKAAAFAAEYGVRRSHGSYEELAADPDVDVVYVASPHNDHFPSAKLCLEGGQAVLVEKPLTVAPAQAEELLALAQERGLFVMEAMWTRTHPLIRHAAELVASGELGDVRHVDAQFGFAFDGPDSHRLLDPAQAGGAILDAGVYPVHAVNLFLGEPEDVLGYGTAASTGVDDHAAALLTYPATSDRPAATASVLCTLRAGLPNRLAVYCTKGRVMFDDFYLRPAELTVWRDGTDAPEELLASWPGGGYTFEAQEVMRCLRAGEVESPLVPWADTLAVSRTLSRWQDAVGAPARTGA